MLSTKSVFKLVAAASLDEEFTGTYNSYVLHKNLQKSKKSVEEEKSSVIVGAIKELHSMISSSRQKNAKIETYHLTIFRIQR